MRPEWASLNCSGVELASAGRMLGDAGQPDRVGRFGLELAVDEVVVHRRPGPAVQALLLGEDRQLR
jgi:hypothetical protein